MSEIPYGKDYPEPPDIDQDGIVPPSVKPKFFNNDGLRARFLADAVMDRVTCGFNPTDERLYVYESGVWTPDRGAMSRRWRLCLVIATETRTAATPLT